MGEKKKYCSSCDEYKPISLFGKRTKSSDGLDYRCGDCRKAYRKKNRNNSYDIIRRRIRGIFKDNRISTDDLLQCNKQELVSYLELYFEPWMNWKNKGRYNGEYFHGWDIDHTQPLCFFDLNNEVELRQACHYTNLRPLCSKLNRDIKKNRSLTDWLEDKPFYFFSVCCFRKIP